jgi:uncharacterized protein
MTESPLAVTDTGVVIAVWAVPGASHSAINGLHGGRVKIRVTSPPEGGRANQEIAGLLEKRLGSKVGIKSGMRGRSKVFEVFQTDIETVRRKLGV